MFSTSSSLANLKELALAIAMLIAQHPGHAQTAASDRKMKFLALGDSYTIGESVGEPDRWPNQLVSALQKRGWNIGAPTIIATTGWRTDNLKNALQIARLGNDFDMVALLIGVNNQYQGRSAEAYGPEFEELLEKAIKMARGDKGRVFVVSIPDYGFTPFGKATKEEITAGINSFNAVNKKITTEAGVRYVDITGISRLGLDQPELVAADGLHPSGKMYALWVNKILGAIAP